MPGVDGLDITGAELRVIESRKHCFEAEALQRPVRELAEWRHSDAGHPHLAHATLRNEKPGAPFLAAAGPA
jgi:hypothetical protein